MATVTNGLKHVTPLRKIQTKNNTFEHFFAITLDLPICASISTKKSLLFLSHNTRENVPIYKDYNEKFKRVVFWWTLRKLYFHFLPHRMRYDHGGSFLFNFEPNGIPFGSKLKGKLSPRSYPIQCERKWKYSFLSEERE